MILIYTKKLWENWRNLSNNLPTFKKVLFHIKVLKNCFKDEYCISNSIFKIFSKSDSTLRTVNYNDIMIYLKRLIIERIFLRSNIVLFLIPVKGKLRNLCKFQIYPKSFLRCFKESHKLFGLPD